MWVRREEEWLSLRRTEPLSCQSEHEKLSLRSVVFKLELISDTMRGEGAGRGRGESYNFLYVVTLSQSQIAEQPWQVPGILLQPEGVISTTRREVKYPSGIPITVDLSQLVCSFLSPQIQSPGIGVGKGGACRSRSR